MPPLSQRGNCAALCCAFAFGAGKRAHGGVRRPAARVDGGGGRCHHRRQSWGFVVGCGPGDGRSSGDGALVLAAVARPQHHLSARWPVDDVRRADSGDWPVHRAVRRLLLGPGRFGAQVLQPDDAVHGRHVGCGAVGQPAGAGGVLGTDQHLVLPVGGLLGTPARRTRWRAPSAGRDRRRWLGHARGLCAAGPDRRQL